MGVAGQPVQLFFLGCVIVAGLYGAMTVGIKILFVQTVPAALAVAAILLSR
jgi:putative membrane protein